MPVLPAIAIGAVVGAASAAITGGNVLKGAAFGALGGGIGSAVSGAIGGVAGGEAGGLVGGEAAAGLSAADAAGLAQMAADAGLTGAAADAFVASGGTMGSTAFGGGGVGYGAAGGEGSSMSFSSGPNASSGPATVDGGGVADTVSTGGPGTTELANARDLPSKTQQLAQETLNPSAPSGSGDVAGAFDMGGASGTGIPESWGITGPAQAAPKGLIDSAMDWAKKNPDVVGKGLTEAAKSVMNVQAAKTKAQADLENKEKLALFYRDFIQSSSVGGAGVTIPGSTGPTQSLRRPGGGLVFNAMNGYLN